MATFPADDGGAVGPGPHQDDFYEDELEDEPEGEDDEDDDAAYLNIKKELAEALDYVESAGTFASQGELPFIDPQINVHNVGPISLPLQGSQARQIMEQAHQAQYGKGSETLVDTAVRNTLELNPDQFDLGNPDWDNYVKQACVSVAQDLGVDAPVSAELYKMLIYEKDAMFKPHTDTEKAPGMFATLVIGLPSPFEGGGVAVKHQGEKMILKTLKHGFSYVSWYSDVIHEVLPVRSGYRWVLTYNLCVDPSRPSPTACLQTDEAYDVHRILKAWLDQDAQMDRELTHAYYRLDHEYTQANISLNALKGRDMATVHLLREIAKTLDLDVFLAVIEKREHGSCEYDYNRKYDGFSRKKSYKSYNSYSDGEDDDEDYYGRSGTLHEFEEIFDTSYKIDTLVDLDGCPVVRKMRLDQDNVLQEECFDVEAKEDYMGYQGNWGPELTHWYRVAVVAIVPRDSVTQFLKNSWERPGSSLHSGFASLDRENKTSVIGYLAKSVLGTPGDQSLAKCLRELCEEVWTVSEPERPGAYNPPPKTVLPEAVITKVLQAAVVLNDQSFIKDAVNHHEGNLSLDFFIWAREHVANDATAFDSLKDIVLNAILSFPMLWKRQVAVNNFVPPTDTMSEEVRLWIQTVHDKTLELIPQQDLGHEDGFAVIDMIPGYHDFAYLSTRVVPLVEARLAATSFILAFLSRLDQRTTEGAFPPADGSNLYKQVVKSLIEKIDVHTLSIPEVIDEQAARAARLRALLHGSEEPEPAPPAKSSLVTPQILADFISTLIRITADGDSMMGVLSRRISFRAPAIEVSKFHSLWLPFLHALIKIYEENSIPTSTPDDKQIFGAILKAYINTYVGEMPSRDGTLVRPNVRACCRDCFSLNDFLSDPTQRVGRFAVNKQRRQHLHQKLDSAKIDCTHETERMGSPQTLVVTKTSQHHESDVLAWKKRKTEAATKLLEFNKRDLTVWLGDDHDQLMGMVGLGRPSARRQARQAPPPPPQQQQPQSLAPILPNQQIQPRLPPSSSTSGGYDWLFNNPSRKRKAAEMDVVDLTGDD